MAHPTSRKKPIPRHLRKTVNRAHQRKRDDTIQDVSVSLMDMDSAIMFYFEKLTKLMKAAFMMRFLALMLQI